MRCYVTIWLACLTGCVTSPVYVPGLHPSAPLGSKGSVSASYVVRAPKARETHVAVMLSDRWFIRGGHNTADHGQLTNSHLDLALGRVTRDSSAQVRQSVGFTSGDGTSSIASFFDFAKYEGAPYAASGRYERLYLQHVVTRRFGVLEVGGAARLSAVRVFGYRRMSGHTRTNKAVGGPYDRDTTFSGNLSGVFAEPGLFIGLNFGGIRVTPQLAFAMPLTPTAFGAYPADAGITFAIDSDILKRW